MYQLEVHGQGKGFDEIKTDFYRQFLPVDYNAYIRKEFRTRKQQIYEPSANYICAMRRILQRTG